MAQEKGGKVRIVGYVSPFLKKKIDELIESGEFASESDLVSHSVAWFIKEYFDQKKEGHKVKLK